MQQQTPQMIHVVDNIQKMTYFFVFQSSKQNLRHKNLITCILYYILIIAQVIVLTIQQFLKIIVYQLKMQQQVLNGEPQRSKLVDEDPYQKSYQDSAVQYLPYRVFLIVAAIGFLQLGKSSLPQDAVPCIQDVVNQALINIANFFNKYPGFGLTLMTIMQLLCDVQLVGMVIYWVGWAKSFTYPLAVGSLAIAKVLINIMFKTRDISNSFKDRVFVSLLFGENFQNTYFFSGITAFLVMNALQFWSFNYKKLLIAEISIIVYVVFLLLAMGLNFFMDVTTGLAFGYIVYTLIDTKRQKIDTFLLNPVQIIKGWLGRNQSESQN